MKRKVQETRFITGFFGFRRFWLWAGIANSHYKGFILKAKILNPITPKSKGIIKPEYSKPTIEKLSAPIKIYKMKPNKMNIKDESKAAINIFLLLYNLR